MKSNIIYEEVGDGDIQAIPNLRNTGFDQQTATNVKNHLHLVDDILESSTKELLEYKKDVENLRQELTLMRQRIQNNNEEIKNTTTPSIDALLRDLKLSISAQKDENAKLQTQITELKKEKSQIQQLIIVCVQKVQQLEEQNVEERKYEGLGDYKSGLSFKSKDKKIFKKSPEVYRRKKASGFTRDTRKNENDSDSSSNKENSNIKAQLENYFHQSQKDSLEKYRKLFQKKDLEEGLKKIIIENNQELGIDRTSSLLRAEILENVNEYEFDMEDLEKIFNTFGKIERIVIRQKGIAFISFDDSLCAYFAQKTMNNFLIPDTDLKIKVQICVVKEEDFTKKENIFEVSDEEVYKKFVIPYSEDLEDSNEFFDSGSYLYFTKFILPIEETSFCLKERILGVKACNIHRIYYLCHKNYNDEKNTLDIKLYISNKDESEITIIISGNSLENFSQAVKLVHELLANVIEEYKKFCEKRRISIKSDIHIQKVEKYLKVPELTFIESKND